LRESERVQAQREATRGNTTVITTFSSVCLYHVPYVENKLSHWHTSLHSGIYLVVEDATSGTATFLKQLHFRFRDTSSEYLERI